MTTHAENATKLAFWQIGFLLLAVLIVFSRRPDAFMNPQFWAEDGAQWYADAYNFAWWKVLLTPRAGYIQLLPRLCATIALLVPLQLAPTVCNAAGIALQILPALYFLSSRFASVAGFATRAYLSFLYLALRNSSEPNANITCAQWHLAILVFLVVIAEPPRNVAWRIFDVLAIALCVLSGPFSMFLAPLAFVWWWKRRQKWRLVPAVMLTVGAAIQAATIAEFGTEGRSHEVLGATAGRLLKILAAKVFLASVVGGHGLGSTEPGWNAYLLIATLVVALASGVLVYSLVRGPLELKLFIVFGMMLLTAALIWPMASISTPQWYLLQVSRSGLRYWLVPMLAFVVTLVWSAGRNCPPFLRVTALTLLLLMVIGIIRDWRYPPLPDLHFAQYASSFRHAGPGARFRIPLNPQGWSMELIKPRSSKVYSED